LLSEISVAEVDRYRQAKVRAGKLSATSINNTITRLGQILDLATERELIDRNPVRVNPRRRKLRQRRPERSYLDRAEQIVALLDAAGEFDAEARPDRQGTARRALLATLAFAGPRLGEALALRWRDVDLAGGRLRVGQSKTDAGVRTIELLPALRDESTSWKVRTRYGQPTALVFGTENGREQSPSHVRNRILANAVKRATERLEANDRAPLPTGLTPHSLRRTFASALFALGRELPFVMAQLGHTDPAMTLGIYARVMLDGETEREALRALVDGADWAATGSETASGEVPAPDPLGAEPPESAPSSGKRGTRPAGFEPAASRSGGGRSIH
jgi:integrase